MRVFIGARSCSVFIVTLISAFAGVVTYVVAVTVLPDITGSATELAAVAVWTTTGRVGVRRDNQVILFRAAAAAVGGWRLLIADRAAP